jgi:rubrerythrin
MTDEKALKEELQALEIALKTEEDGYKYFQEAAQRTQNPVARRFFNSIANDECQHIFLIKEFHKSLQEKRGGEGIVLPKDHTDYKIRMKTIFEDARKDLKGTVKSDTGVLDVYRTAMDLETKASNFYKERSAKTKFPHIKEMYDWLFMFESDHYRMFSESLSYLEKPDMWFMEQEKPIFEG